MKFHQDKKMKEQRAKKEESAKLKRIASSMAKEIKQFWQAVEKVYQPFAKFLCFTKQSQLDETFY